jgi:hypothetical protein
MSGTLGVTGAVTAANGLTVDDAGATPLTVDRATNDGTIIDVQRGGSSVGGINAHGGSLVVGGGDVGIGFYQGANALVPYDQSTNAVRDNAIDLGYPSTYRWKDLYLSGGAYLGGTGAANKLDDYEIGTYNPQYLATGSSGSNAYSYQTGIYTKVGRLCRVWIDINITSSSGMSGTPCISLPFTSNNQADMGSFTPWDVSNNFTSSRHVTQWMSSNTDIMLMYTWVGDSNTGHTVLQINTTGRISGGLMYQTN